MLIVISIRNEDENYTLLKLIRNYDFNLVDKKYLVTIDSSNDQSQNFIDSCTFRNHTRKSLLNNCSFDYLFEWLVCELHSSIEIFLPVHKLIRNQSSAHLHLNRGVKDFIIANDGGSLCLKNSFSSLPFFRKIYMIWLKSLGNIFIIISTKF
jgi:hypothetical protein